MTITRRIGLMLMALLAGGAMVWAQNSQGVRVHEVKSGETLYRIGLQYDVSVAELYELNPDARSGIKPGQKLTLPARVGGQGASSEPIYHIVQAKETLYSIARSYGVTVEEILAANDQLKSAEQVPVGIILEIPPRSSSAHRPPSSTPPPAPVKPTEGVTGLKMYTVPPKATIYSILQSTGWTEEQFYHYNPQARSGLQAGATILIPDVEIKNNLAYGTAAFPMGDAYSIVLALPFSRDSGNRFTLYYEGFLLALLEAKKEGKNIQLYTVDSDDAKMSETIAFLELLPKIDMIIGGVSESSVQQLATTARSKDATYVIPFTSRDYSTMARSGLNIYQVNTPHTDLYREAAQQFVNHYRGYNIQIVRFVGDQSNKGDFISILKEQLNRSGMHYNEVDQSAFSSMDHAVALSNAYPYSVVVPDASSLVAANNVLTPIAHAVDSLGIMNVTAFGYPEWQTYTSTIGKALETAEGTFYSTFIAEPKNQDYKDFEKEFMSWFGHGLGRTYPRYGLLGYDTGRYFIELLGKDAPSGRRWRGIQSQFEFVPSPQVPSLRSNHGVFFVKYSRYGNPRRL